MVSYNNAADYQVTQYNVVTGGSSNLLNNVAPSATSGVPLISQGSSSQPAFGTAVVAGGGTGDTSFTAYAPICGGTSTTGALQSAATGISTSGYVLTSNGASSLPTFQSIGAAGSGWIYLGAQTASSSASLVFTSLISGTYDNYVIIFDSLVQASNSNLYIQLSSNNGSSYISTGYSFGLNATEYNSTTASNNSGSGGYVIGGASSSYYQSGTAYLNGLTSGSVYPSMHGTGLQNNGSTPYFETFVASYNTKTAMNALQIIAGTGNITSGTAILFGITQT